MTGGKPGSASAIFTLQQVVATLQRGDLGVSAKLDQVFEAALAQRMSTIAQALAPSLGDVVRRGPFAGMTYTGATAEGCVVPKLLGCYEQELHPVIEAVIGREYDAIVNVGCAEGYYAIGLARTLPTAMVHAYDIDENARNRCRDLAERNGVGDRVHIGGTLTPENFAAFAGQRTLVVCDIEGAEFSLLDPVLAPALATFDLLVEIHPDDTNSLETFTKRFTTTHRIDIIEPQARDPECFPELVNLTPLEKPLALIERLTATPWVMMMCKAVTH